MPLAERNFIPKWAVLSSACLFYEPNQIEMQLIGIILDKLAFIGCVKDSGGISRSVVLMDPRTIRVSHLPDLSRGREWPACAANDSQMFVFGDWDRDKPGTFASEFYKIGAKR